MKRWNLLHLICSKKKLLVKNSLFQTEGLLVCKLYFKIGFNGETERELDSTTSFQTDPSLTHFIAVKTSWWADDLSRKWVLTLAGYRSIWLPMGSTAGYQ